MACPPHVSKPTNEYANEPAKPDDDQQHHYHGDGHFRHRPALPSDAIIRTPRVSFLGSVSMALPRDRAFGKSGPWRRNMTMPAWQRSRSCSRPWLWSRCAANRGNDDLSRERAVGRAVQGANANGTLGSEIARRALPAPNGEHEQELQ